MGFLDQLGDVQQSFGGNAAAVEADAARVHFLINERDLHAEIGSEKSGSVATGSGADYRDAQVGGFSHLAS